MDERKTVVAVDFDGTLARTMYPTILEPKKDMIEYCKELKADGAILILWTCRKGQHLEEAVTFCRSHGLEFDYVNENTPQVIELFGGDSRKICADIYIDDKALNVNDLP